LYHVINEALENNENSDLIQCVVKIKDIGNEYEFQGIIEDNSNYISQYDVDVEFQNRLEIEEPTIQFILAYHRDGNDTEFFDENGIAYDFDIDNYNKFKDEVSRPLQNPTVPNSIDDIA
jgi:hypothetical protein